MTLIEFFVNLLVGFLAIIIVIGIFTYVIVQIGKALQPIWKPMQKPLMDGVFVIKEWIQAILKKEKR